ncbi:S-adenosyl-L-methionine-dependent methyltransferase [Melampsora americana]|nr:S-adenosyl-L-methionine-dependent methyltransferase [Melampsora americana]
MNLCLNHPSLGYYSKPNTNRTESSDPFGKSGDFITSPEISQIFGELIGVWFLSRWMDFGSPESIRIIELGPGRGTLISDILRTFKSIKSCNPEIKEIHLVENSPFLRKIQEEKLSTDLSDGNTKLYWYDRVEEIEESSDHWTMIIAHEFFDALPIHVFQKTEKGFREILVDIDDEHRSTAPIGLIKSIKPIRFVLASKPTVGSQTLIQEKDYGKFSIGSKIEISPLSLSVAFHLSKLLKLGNGSGLIVDYGDDHHFADSLRGFHKHQIVDPLHKPGLTDLTANVNFSKIKEMMNPFCKTYGPISQREFLLKMGIEIRKQKLKKIESSVARLISPIGMGHQYKFLGIESFRKDQEDCQTEVYPFS